MNERESAVLLVHICAFDGRQVMEAQAMAWASALPDVALDEALAVLPGFFRNATRDSWNRIYPGDILSGVRKLRARRVSDAWESAKTSALAAGASPEDAYQAAVLAAKAVRESMPPQIVARVDSLASARQGGW